MKRGWLMYKKKGQFMYTKKSNASQAQLAHIAGGVYPPGQDESSAQAICQHYVRLPQQFTGIH